MLHTANSESQSGDVWSTSWSFMALFSTCESPAAMTSPRLLGNVQDHVAEALLPCHGNGQHSTCKNGDWGMVYHCTTLVIECAHHPSTPAMNLVHHITPYKFV